MFHIFIIQIVLEKEKMDNLFIDEEGQLILIDTFTNVTYGVTGFVTSVFGVDKYVLKILD